MKSLFKYGHLSVMLTLYSYPLFAHNINYVLQHAPKTDVIWSYLKLGFIHIIPHGPDHILFVISLCLLNARLKTILWQATAFTIAHTITLVLSMKNIIVAPSAIIEPIIALSIAFVAIENLFINELKPWRIVLVFIFGLIHGMGFAATLNEVGLPPDDFLLSIVSFNIGVELGQIAIIALMYSLLIHPFGSKNSFKKVIVYPLSVCIAVIASFWTLNHFFPDIYSK